MDHWKWEVLLAVNQEVSPLLYVGSLQAGEREDCSISDSTNNSTTKKEKKMKERVGKNRTAVANMGRRGKKCGCERPWQ